MTNASSISSETLAVFETVPDLYLILSPDLTILTASDAYLAAAFREREAVKGKNVFEVFPDNPALPDADATANLADSLQQVLRLKQTHQMPLQRYDVARTNQPTVFEEKYWLSTNTPVLDKEGNVSYIIHKVEDATKLIIAQKHVKDSENQLKELSKQQDIYNKELSAVRAEADLHRDKLHHILMRAPALICIFEGPQHVFKLVNPLYQQLVGQRPLLGKPIAEAMPELAGQPIFGLLDQVYKTGEEFFAHEMKVQLDHTNTGGLGHNFYNFIYQATHDLQGEVDGVMVFAYEVTAQVDARHKVEQRENALQELNKLLGAANRNLSETQRALEELNLELEQRVLDRTQELQLARTKIEDQRNHLQELIMAAPTPICILDGAEFVYELVNPAYQQLLPGRKLVGNSLVKVALPEMAHQSFAHVLQQVYRTGETIEIKEELIAVARHEDGPLEDRFFNYTVQPRHDEQGQIDGVLVYAIEVTDQVKARQAAEQSAERLRLITDALPVLIGYLDKDEKYRFANKAYETWFPMKSDDLLGRAVRDVVGEKAYQGVKGYIDRALAGERLDFESRMPYREDFIKYIHTSYVPDIREGKVAGFYTLVNDVTEQAEARIQIEQREKEAQALAEKLAEANEEAHSNNTALIQANDQLLRINLDLDNFIYAASHDLKAPISNIEGLMRILFTFLPDKDQAPQEMLDITAMIEDSIARFKRTIDHLTEVTKLQKDNNQDAVMVNLSKVIQEIKLDLKPQLESSGAILEVDVEACPSFNFSEKNLRSVIYNLLSNAIKYQSPGRRPHVRLLCKQESEFAVLTVQDNGLGMENLADSKLFTMFGRLHDHVEGSGVGLYMVKKIVENAGGRIEVESQLGVGSTFRVYLRK